MLDPTVWRPTDGIGEASQSDDALIATESGFIITTEDNKLLRVETGQYTKLAATEWVQDEGE